jgi:hypothetical protein
MEGANDADDGWGSDRMMKLRIYPSIGQHATNLSSRHVLRLFVLALSSALRTTPCSLSYISRVIESS